MSSMKTKVTSKTKRPRKSFIPPAGWVPREGYKLQSIHTARCERCKRHCTDNNPLRTCDKCHCQICWICEQERNGDLAHNCFFERIAPQKQHFAERHATDNLIEDAGEGSSGITSAERFAANRSHDHLQPQSLNEAAGCSRGATSHDNNSQVRDMLTDAPLPSPKCHTLDYADHSLGGERHENMMKPCGTPQVHSVALHQITEMEFNVSEKTRGKRRRSDEQAHSMAHSLFLCMDDADHMSQPVGNEDNTVAAHSQLDSADSSLLMEKNDKAETSARSGRVKIRRRTGDEAAPRKNQPSNGHFEAKAGLATYPVSPRMAAGLSHPLQVPTESKCRKIRIPRGYKSTPPGTPLKKAYGSEESKSIANNCNVAAEVVAEARSAQILFQAARILTAQPEEEAQIVKELVAQCASGQETFAIKPSACASLPQGASASPSSSNAHDDYIYTNSPSMVQQESGTLRHSLQGEDGASPIQAEVWSAARPHPQSLAATMRAQLARLYTTSYGPVYITPTSNTLQSSNAEPASPTSSVRHGRRGMDIENVLNRSGTNTGP